MTDTCEKCGATLQVGDWFACPHGRSASAVVQDEIPGGQWFENGFETPQKFYSHSEHRAALAARGLEIRAKFAGEHDKHLTNWAAGIDAQTMANAAALLSRGRREPEPDYEPIPITVTNIRFEKES